MTEAESETSTKRTQRSTEILGNVEVPIEWYHDWVKEHIAEQTPEKVAIITGSNSGTGFWCAKAMVQTGATVVLACRNVEKAEAAKEDIRKEFPDAKLDVIALDTAKLATIKEFAKTIQEKYQRVDWLVNNAGIMALNFSKTEDGHEIQWQTNHLGHFLLTKLLWPTIAQTPGETRIVQHSSSMHSIGFPKFDSTSMEFPKHGFFSWPIWNILLPLAKLPKHNWARYGVSKLSNVLFMRGLEQKINQLEITKDPSKEGKKVLSLACHPGYAKTQLQLVAAEHQATGRMGVGTKDGAQSAADGSLPLLMACLSKQVDNGDYLGPKQYMKGPPIKTKVGGFGNDPEQIQSLWDYSEECIGEKFEL